MSSQLSPLQLVTIICGRLISPEALSVRRDKKNRIAHRAAQNGCVVLLASDRGAMYPLSSAFAAVRML